MSGYSEVHYRYDPDRGVLEAIGAVTADEHGQVTLVPLQSLGHSPGMEVVDVGSAVGSDCCHSELSHLDHPRISELQPAGWTLNLSTPNLPFIVLSFREESQTACAVSAKRRY